MTNHIKIKMIDNIIASIEKHRAGEEQKADDLNCVLTGDDFYYMLHNCNARYYAGYIDGLKSLKGLLEVD